MVWSLLFIWKAFRSMNERIKELAEQANIHFSRVGILDGDPNGSARMVGYSKMEKFAELIVRECSKVIVNGGQRKGAFGNEDLRPYEIATMIKEHFGVEL